MSTAVIGAPEFRARSGRTVRSNEDGSVTFEGVRGYLGPEQVFDAQEFFQAQRDLALGRWRWPANPDYVVYPIADPEYVIASSELTGHTEVVARGHIPSRLPSEGLLSTAAYAYFQAHPERKRPWEEAEHGEIWELTFENGQSSMWVRDHRAWHLLGVPSKPPVQWRFTVTAGRKVWPEDAS